MFVFQVIRIKTIRNKIKIKIIIEKLKLSNIIYNFSKISIRNHK